MCTEVAVQCNVLYWSGHGGGAQSDSPQTRRREGGGGGGLHIESQHADGDIRQPERSHDITNISFSVLSRFVLSKIGEI